MYVLFLVLFLTYTPAEAQWTQWRGPTGDAHIQRFTVPEVWPASPEKIWRVEVGRGDGSPVAADGRVFAHSRKNDWEIVTALDFGTGEVIWEERYGPIAYIWPWPGAESRERGPFSTPALADGRLFTFGVTQTLSAYDAESGELLWRKAFDKTLGFGTSTSPIVVGDLCIVHVGEPKEGALTAFDVVTGEVRWEAAYDGPSYASPLLTTLHGMRQLVVLSAKVLAGVAPESGEILWQMDVPHPWDENIPTPVQVGDTFIYSAIAQGTKAFCVTREGGEWAASQVWHNDRLSLYTSTPVAVEGVLYGFSGSKKGQFFALDPSNGEIIWTSPGRQGEHASIVAAGDLILALKGDGELIAFTATSDAFDLVANLLVANTTTWAHPNLFGDSLLVKDAGGIALLTLNSGPAVTGDAKEVRDEDIEAHKIVSMEWEKDGAEMVLIPAGTFQMGSESGDPDERPVREVHVDGFYMDRYEVTNAQYRLFMEATGHRPQPSKWQDENYNRPEQPVVGVSWDDASAYAAWAGKRLPTEAEWEKAGRGGLVGRQYPWGDEPPDADSVFRANYEFLGKKMLPEYGTTYPVGTFDPNQYGLYDMAGNVWEWTLDPYYEDAYEEAGGQNPVGKGESIETVLSAASEAEVTRVTRGGSHQDYDNLIRVADRGWVPEGWRTLGIGFRTVVEER